MFSGLTGNLRISTKDGFWGGILIGLSLGLLWTPCVGPIIASVITLAATSTINLSAFFITLAYSLGTALPMLAVMYGGRSLLEKTGLAKNAGYIQKWFGLLMILTAIGIFFQVDRRFQTYILNTFPNYSENLTKLEDNKMIEEGLERINK